MVLRRRFNLKTCLAVLLIASVGLSSDVGAGMKGWKCPPWVTRKPRNFYEKRVVPYLQQYDESNGWRLIFRPVDPEKIAHIGFAKYPKSFWGRAGYWVKFPFRSFAYPFQKGYNVLISQPQSWLTRKLGLARRLGLDGPIRAGAQVGERAPKALVLSRVLTIPVGFWLFDHYWDRLTEDKYEKELIENFDKILGKRKDGLEAAILYDYRFDEFRVPYLVEAKTEADKKEILSKAVDLEVAYGQYYMFIQGLVESLPQGVDLETQLMSPAVLEKLKHFALFADIEQAAENTLDVQRGVSKNGEFVDDDELRVETVPLSSDAKKIDPETLKKLYLSRHRLLILYDLIREAFDPESEVDPKSDLGEQLQAIRNDAFTQKVKAVLERKKIDPKQIIYYVQEDAFWQAQFDFWQILGVKKFPFTDPSSGETILHTDYSIDKIRTETLEQIEKNPLPKK